MVKNKNAQNWLDEHERYSNKGQTREIFGRSEGLKGKLIIEGYEKVWNIELSDNSELEIIELKDLPNLTRFWVNKCRIRKVKIDNCPEITDLNVANNLLESTKFLNGLDNPEKLRRLSIHSNNFKAQTLDFLSKFVNLKGLYIDNCDEGKFKQGIYNRWQGSLKPLQNMRKLKWLSIGNTDIDSGLEYLPYSLRKIGCDSSEWKEKEEKKKVWGCSKILEELEKISKFPGVTESLKGKEKGQEYFMRDYYRMAPWWQANVLPIIKEIEKKEVKKMELEKEVFGMNRIETLLYNSSESEKGEHKSKKNDLEDKSKEIAEEIRELNNKRKKIEKRDKFRIKNLRNWIEKEEKSLREKVKKFDEVYQKDIEEIMELQVEIIRFNDNSASRKKEDLFSKFPYHQFIIEELNSICNKQTEITELKMKLEEMEKSFEITNRIKKERDEDDKIEVVPNMPKWLEEEIKRKGEFEEDYRVKEMSYDKILPNKDNFLSYKDNKIKDLPIRLYNIEKDEVEEINSETDIKNYAILSYVWGMSGEINDNNINFTQYKDKLNPLGYKAFYKAIQTCKLLGVNYLWIDQLCINQNDIEEKNQEVPKMRRYYSNATVTLIAIHRDVNVHKNCFDSPVFLESIIRSKWFTRSWILQEGFLSKWTVFMFDNCLVDGREMAKRWVLQQPSYSGYAKFSDLKEADEGAKKIATPLGWTYYKKGYSSDDKVSLSLSEALRIIKKRERGVSIDGIYSILGLLSYGEHVKPKYKLEGEKYTKAELEEALLEVMRVAAKNRDYGGEFLAWHGSSNVAGWLPKLDDKGSAQVEGGIKISNKFGKGVFEKDGSILLNAFPYTICCPVGELSKYEKGFLIDSGTCTRDVIVKWIDSNGICKYRKITILGTNEVLDKVKKDDVLLMFNNNEWKSNKPFAILVEEKQGNTYRVGLIEFLSKSEAEGLKGAKERKIRISESNLKQQEQVSQMEQLLKNDNR